VYNLMNLLVEDRFSFFSFLKLFPLPLFNLSPPSLLQVSKEAKLQAERREAGMVVYGWN
jgi:hypothetical protein